MIISNENETFGKSLTSVNCVNNWVHEIIALTKPQSIFWCDGSDKEDVFIRNLMIASGTAILLNSYKRPNSLLVRSHPNDVARVEEKTFVCSSHQRNAGPTNNWIEPIKMKQKLNHLFDGCMAGRTLYIIPFSMGPIDSPYAQYGIEITDSPYVVANMRIMTRVSPLVYNHIEKKGYFVKCLHSVGLPLKECERDSKWPCNPENTTIAHFPEELLVMSFGSGYGGNALLGKKCFALRIASSLAHHNKWLAEHMLILGIQSPDQKKKYVTAAFPSGCGKTNFAMMRTPQNLANEGWSLSCVGDDIAWIYPNDDGWLHAINPEFGFFGIAPGTSWESNPIAMQTVTSNTIFTNVALTDDGDVWWEGMTKEKPDHLIDWLGNDWYPSSNTLSSHPNSRFTAPLKNCPIIDENVENPGGVQISAIIFGGRRATTMPLIFESFNWVHGVYLGATIGSETTAAAVGTLGKVRRDPMAMLPFCGYNVGDYFSHWLEMRRTIKYLPRFFHVNWFRKNAEGNFLWPGFSENARLLKWIVERCSHGAHAVETAIGWMPEYQDISMEGLEDKISTEIFEELQIINSTEWHKELLLQDELFIKIYRYLPKEIVFQRELLMSRL